MILPMLAARNVLRQRRRSILTGLSITIGFALLLVATGLGDGAHAAMAEAGVRMGLGDTIVQANGYRSDPSLDRLIADPEPIEQALRAAGPELTAAAPRLRTEALLQAGDQSMGVVLSGVDPRVEARVSNIESRRAMVAGSPLAADDDASSHGALLPPILVGKTLASTLGVRIDDRVTVTLRPAGGGSPRVGAFRVQGIFATGVRDIDGGWAEVPLGPLQALASAGRGVTMVAAILRSVADTPGFTERAAQRLQGHGVEVIPWAKAAPELYATILLDEGSMYFMTAIVFLVVAAGILNTILMSVLERTRELGVLLALGARPAMVVALVLTEAAVLGCVALAAGLAVGLGVHHYFATAGFNLRAALGADVEMSGIVLPDHFYSYLSTGKIVWSSVAVFALVLAGGVYPAIRASRLEPVEAIRHV
jgi:ABC-type lipoprotein release transport system permease subunit